MQKRVSLYLLVLLIIPVVIYGILQISSLSEDEKNINLIYQNQLDAILFSINQYSDDVVNDWILTMEESMKKGSPGTSLDLMLQVNPAIRMVFTADTLSGTVREVYPDSLHDSALSAAASEALEARKKNINTLLGYLSAGYQKIETVKLQSGDGEPLQLLLYFILKNPSPSGNRVGGILIDAQSFINITLGPRLQTIAQDRFIISAFRKEQPVPVFSTEDSLQTDMDETMAITKDFWLLPDYYLGIDALGESVVDIIRTRTIINIALLVTMLVILAVGLFMIFRNVKKELRLAQNKSEFVSNVSHELRTPLALISMFAETLEMGRVKTEEKKQEYYQIIHKETTRLTGIVNKILTFSQMDANRKEFHMSEADLNEIVAEILDTYSFHFQQKGFDCEFQNNEAPLPVRADREAMHEVLINLLDNAIKYSPGSGKIEVTTGYNGENAYVTVKDYGIGIRKEDQAHIFEKFYRVSTGDIAKSKGTGLGLSLVRHIVDNHSGRITVDSTYGKGSAFTIYIPLIKSNNG